MIVKNATPTYVLLQGMGWKTNVYTFRKTENGMVRVTFRCPTDPQRDYEGITTVEDARELWKYLTKKGYYRW